MSSDATHRYIVARVRELARRRKWSQNQLADFAGISRAQMSRMLKLTNSPSIETLGKIAAALDTKIRELLPA